MNSMDVKIDEFVFDSLTNSCVKNLIIAQYCSLSSQAIQINRRLERFNRLAATLTGKKIKTKNILANMCE